MNDRSELAARWGVEPAYFDVRGQRREADPDALQRVFEALAGSGVAPSDYPARPPRMSFQGNGRRDWILAVQLYAVRSARNWGHGDFSDLAELLKIVTEVGGGGIGLNPLHALFYDRPGTGSPYSPSSRLFLNPLYIDVEAVEEFAPDHAEPFAAEIARHRAGEWIDYLSVAQLKLAILRKTHTAFLARGSEARRQDFAAYRAEGGRDLALFAAFETLRAQHSGAWPDWPDPWRTPSDEMLEHLRSRHAEEMDFHAFLQWNAGRQLGRCRDIANRSGLGIGLYLDTAIGVDGAGADAWMAHGAMLRGLSVGAPPDQYNPTGQNWGLTAYNPHALVARDFQPFRQMLRASMRFAGAVRIDHVLGLMRLFVIPDGLGAERGVYLRFPFAAMLDVVAEESLRWRCIVIGEDLGTVPGDFRAMLSASGVWSYLVMLFERNGDGSFRRPDEYPEMAIATLNTHDLPTFSGWISGHDLRTKRAIGVDPGESDDERESSRAALRAALGDAASFADVIAFLAMAPTRLLSVSIEDVLEIEDQINVPGTVDQHPNWRRRWPLTVEALADDPRFRRIADVLAKAGRRSR
jgi:4-alpha-glucanotransferase